MNRIAIYGKGGIGKSTIASNISACLAAQGEKILQIGCDPKHDSTILISLNEYSTVLDLLRTGSLIDEESVIHHGKMGIDCIEIGGPTPGVGCAGRGIIRGIEVLERLGILQKEYDLLVYDILGDVVCGGFFEPIKNHKADVMYVVTSGEFNSLFAANNICAGYNNCQLKEKGLRFGGVIGNLRGIKKEEKIIQQFCEKANVNLVSIVPRDEMIEESTFTGVPVVTAFPNSDVSRIFHDLAQNINDSCFDTRTPSPLTLSELRTLIQATR